MTTLYLFNEDGSLEFCDKVSLTTEYLNRLEKIGTASAESINEGISRIFSHSKSQCAPAKADNQNDCVPMKEGA